MAKGKLTWHWSFQHRLQLTLGRFFFISGGDESVINSSPLLRVVDACWAMRWGQCTLQDLRCREPPRIPRPAAADKPGERRGRGESRSERDRGYCLGDDSLGFYAEKIMQFAVWLVGLMCHLSAFVREALQDQLHPKQGSVFCTYDGD